MDTSKVLPFVSVIIPVYNDRERLELCLDALQQQSYPQDQYEIIVVDNNSTDNLQELCRQYKNVRYAFEEKQSSYAARNKGLSAARGDIIAFTDSDCIPSADWIKNGVRKLLGTPDCGLVGGRIEIFFQDKSHPTAAELYESVKAFPQEILTTINKTSVTANFFTLKQILDSLGGFDSSLESGGDSEMSGRIVMAGYDVAYGEDAVVLHPARHTFAELSRKHRRVTRGLYVKYKRKSKLQVINLVRKYSTHLLYDLYSVMRNDKLIGVRQKMLVAYITVGIGIVGLMETTKLITKDISGRLTLEVTGKAPLSR